MLHSFTESRLIRFNPDVGRAYLSRSGPSRDRNLIARGQQRNRARIAPRRSTGIIPRVDPEDYARPVGFSFLFSRRPRA